MYFDNIDENLKNYFNILSPNGIPNFLEEYIETPEMQKQAGISVTCGKYYTKLFSNEIKCWYSRLDHSVAVALIVWNFTKNKKQTLSALFHDIATPAFKHCIDFLNGDYEKQESTEELTTQIIKNSKEIMELLEKDGIKVEEVEDYHIYPIADNDTPKLSSDRLEYTFSNGYGVVCKIWDLVDIEKMYNNIEIQKNEEGIEELGFKNIEIAEKFVKGMSKLSTIYTRNKDRISLQFIADLIKEMVENNLITERDLYTLSEKQIIEEMKNCKLKNIAHAYKNWENAIEVYNSEEPVENKYCKQLRGKLRYINPLVRTENKINQYKRISEMSRTARENIEYCKNFKDSKYAYFDFDYKGFSNI